MLPECLCPPYAGYPSPLPGGSGGGLCMGLCVMYGLALPLHLSQSTLPIPLQSSVRSKITGFHHAIRTSHMLFLLPPTLFPGSSRTNSSFRAQLKSHHLGSPSYLNILTAPRPPPPPHTQESHFLVYFLKSTCNSLEQSHWLVCSFPRSLSLQWNMSPGTEAPTLCPQCSRCPCVLNERRHSTSPSENPQSRGEQTNSYQLQG